MTGVQTCALPIGTATYPPQRWMEDWPRPKTYRFWAGTTDAVVLARKLRSGARDEAAASQLQRLARGGAPQSLRPWFWCQCAHACNPSQPAGHYEAALRRALAPGSRAQPHSKQIDKDLHRTFGSLPGVRVPLPAASTRATGSVTWDPHGSVWSGTLVACRRLAKTGTASSKVTRAAHAPMITEWVVQSYWVSRRY